MATANIFKFCFSHMFLCFPFFLIFVVFLSIECPLLFKFVYNQVITANLLYESSFTGEKINWQKYWQGRRAWSIWQKDSYYQ